MGTLMTRRMKNADVEGEMREVFTSFDQDGDQIISPSELQSARRELGEELSEEEVNEMVREADAGTGDGKITYPRFLSLMMEMKIGDAASSRPFLRMQLWLEFRHVMVISITASTTTKPI